MRKPNNSRARLSHDSFSLFRSNFEKKSNNSWSALRVTDTFEERLSAASDRCNSGANSGSKLSLRIIAEKNEALWDAQKMMPLFDTPKILALSDGQKILALSDGEKMSSLSDSEKMTLLSDARKMTALGDAPKMMPLGDARKVGRKKVV